jgi:sugar-phosphatase
MILTTDRGEDREILGVLFDMDGTLVDSGAVTERTWHAWAERHGVRNSLVIQHGAPREPPSRPASPMRPPSRGMRTSGRCLWPSALIFSASWPCRARSS